jgi:cytochrome P450
MYVAKNKYFDKEESVKNALKPLFGESVVLDHSDERWAAKRKVLSAAFYKEKLIKMTYLMKEELGKTIAMWKENHADKSEPLDIVQGMADVFMRIIFSCSFGENLTEVTVT